jgi:hypothetical protein
MRAHRCGIGLSILVAVLVLSVTGVSAHAPAQQGTSLRYNDVVRGQITDSNDEQRWVFSGQAGDLIVIDMRATGPGLDSSLSLMGPDGSLITSDDDGGPGFNSRIGPLELPADGAYTILTGRYNGQGDYILELRYLPTIPTLAPEKSLVGTVNAEQPNNFFLLDLTTPSDHDTLWRITVEDDDFYSDPVITVYGPDGLIATSEAEIDGGSIDPIVPLVGESYVVIVSWNADSAGGPYEITLRESARDLLIDGAAQTGTLDSATTSQAHYFRGTEGQMIRVSVRTRDDIAPALEIRSVDYSAYLFFNEGDSAREMRVTLRLPITAVYAIYVRDGSFEGNSGTYTLDFEVIGD